MEWLQIVLGAGGVAFVGALFTGVRQLRESIGTSRNQAMKDLEKWRQDALADAEHYRESVGVWSAYAGTLVYALASAGIPVPPMPPLPVRQREDAEE